MLKNYIKLSLRNLSKNKLFSLINIGGLAIGIAMALLLFLYMEYERGFDSFQSNKNRICRVLSRSTLDVGAVPEKWGCSPNIAGPAFKSEIPAVKEQVRLIRHNFGDPANIKLDHKAFIEHNLYWVDPSVTTVFDFTYLKGNKATALQRPNTIALNESTARSYFGDEDPIGKRITVDNSIVCEVSAVYKDLPPNSSIQPAMMGSFASVKWMQDLTWSNASYETYLLLREDANYKEVEKQITAVSKRLKPASQDWISFSLQPFEEIHLFSAGIQNSYVNNTGDKESVNIVSLLVIVILLIAAINYMNLATARSQKRFREVGICKTLGADRKELIKRFYIETALLVLVSVIIAFLLLILVLPYFNTITHSQLQLGQLLNSRILLLVSGSVVGIIFISGLYPALYLSSFNPKNLFHTHFRSDKFTGMLRQGLVVIQFSGSIVLIFSTIVFYRQLQFIRTKNLGFKPEQVICLNTSGAENTDQLNGLINDLKNLAEVSAVCRLQTFPGKDGSSRTLFKPQQPQHYRQIISCRSGSEVIPALGLHLLAGKTISDQVGEKDSTFQVVLNRTAIEFLGYTPEEAIGKRVNVVSEADEIVGVVEDFHFQTLHEPIGAYAFHNAPTEHRPYMLVRLAMSEDKSRIEEVKKIFSENLPNAAFDFVFLDQHLKSLYAKEAQTVDITLLFSGLAVLLACLGLFGLSAFMIELRIKEIGVRKVLGASVLSIVQLISRKFIFQVLLSGAIALPLSGLLMSRWLNHFAFHISIGWSVGLLTLLIALLTAIFTISFQAIKAAIANPVKSLRTE